VIDFSARSKEHINDIYLELEYPERAGFDCVDLIIGHKKTESLTISRKNCAKLATGFVFVCGH
jgi:hypothetical protein